MFPPCRPNFRIKGRHGLIAALVLFGALSVSAPGPAQAMSTNSVPAACLDARYSDVLVRANSSLRAGLTLQRLTGGIPDTGFANPELTTPVQFDTVDAGIESEGADDVTKGLAGKGKIRSGDLLRISGYVGEQSMRHRRCKTGCWDWSGGRSRCHRRHQGRAMCLVKDV